MAIPLFVWLQFVIQITKAYFPLADLKFITNYEVPGDEIPGNIKDERVWNLGNALQSISKCDIIMVPNTSNFVLPHHIAEHAFGCDIERQVALDYGIPVYEYDISALEDFLNGDFHKKEDK